MMARIGPTFTEELKAAGVTDFRFAWSTETGIVDFHPGVPADERAKVEAVLAAHDGPLSEARHEALEATRAEAARRIAELFQQPPGTLDVLAAEANANARATQILNKKIDGTALPEERLELEVLDGIYNRVTAIRTVKADAKAVLLGAKSLEEVQEAVKVSWPKE